MTKCPPECYTVWGQHRKTYDRCIYGTYRSLEDAKCVRDKLNIMCPDERFYIPEIEE